MMNYPNGHKKNSVDKITNMAGRGMELEKEINSTNSYYLEIDKAVIYKKPTPVTVVKVDYPIRSAAKITEAYFKLPSTTDYNGIYRGKYIDFEAKECQSLTSFPLRSIHPHQIEHLKKVTKHGAIAFVIIRFIKYNETYLVKADTLTEFIQNSTRSSIPYKWFKENGYSIHFHYNKPVDYLEIVDSIFFKE